jgi:hypothetical protein
LDIALYKEVQDLEGKVTRTMSGWGINHEISLSYL